MVCAKILLFVCCTHLAINSVLSVYPDRQADYNDVTGSLYSRGYPSRSEIEHSSNVQSDELEADDSVTNDALTQNAELAYASNAAESDELADAEANRRGNANRASSQAQIAELESASILEADELAQIAQDNRRAKQNHARYAARSQSLKNIENDEALLDDGNLESDELADFHDNRRGHSNHAHLIPRSQSVNSIENDDVLVNYLPQSSRGIQKYVTNGPNRRFWYGGYPSGYSNQQSNYYNSANSLNYENSVSSGSNAQNSYLQPTMPLFGFRRAVSAIDNGYHAKQLELDAADDEFEADHLGRRYVQGIPSAYSNNLFTTPYGHRSPLAGVSYDVNYHVNSLNSPVSSLYDVRRGIPHSDSVSAAIVPLQNRRYLGWYPGYGGYNSNSLNSHYSHKNRLEMENSLNYGSQSSNYGGFGGGYSPYLGLGFRRSGNLRALKSKRHSKHGSRKGSRYQDQANAVVGFRTAKRT